jgi:ferric-dicitrate binding protein FerR (iron transport regulator)
MNIPSHAAAAAKLLSSRLTTTRPVPDERERGIATIERAMQARVRRRRAVAGGVVLAAAAALALMAQEVRHSANRAAAPTLIAINVSPAGRGAALRAGDRAQPLTEGAALGAGQRIETPADGGASLQLSTGTAMDLSGSTSFRVDSQGPIERFSLQRGELSAHVAKLTSAQRFIVTTPDAEVEVRGTRFRVGVLDRGEACGGGSRTRLEVSEGVVEVRGTGASILIRAGQHWPSDCETGRATTAVEPAAPTSDARPRLREVKPTAATAPERASALTQQNDLFAEGVALRRQGDVGGALRVYQEVIERFPNSPLAENARVERMRVLAKNHDRRATGEARLYLARYPHGFAAQEAQQLMAEP